MKNTKKALLMTLCAVMLVAASVMGTLAYLQDTTDVVTNTFTVGKVEITLDEAPVDLYGEVVAGDRRTENEYKLIPGHEYKKDPTVHVIAGSEQCWLFVKVENDISAIEADTKIAAQMENNGWKPVAGAENVYYFDGIVDAREVAVDKIVFANFTVAGTADVAQYAEATIEIDAYAIQADGFATAAAAWAANGNQWID